MSKQYLPSSFEKKWAKMWQDQNTYQTDNSKLNKKIYALSMFPYPSGDGLHVGHVRIYTGTDVLARYFRMKGYDVLHPMGWDAFGLPAENAAIKAQKNPIEMVPHNIANFKKQMQSIGLSYDWRREIATTDPEYYRITQWLFLEFFKLGLLYKKDTPVYFCNSCQTGLAEEEVLPDGTHERCGKPITRKNLPQWIFKITDYSDSLLSGLANLKWPKGIIEMQKNWIGKKSGVNINYKVKNTNTVITCFTTRPDTNFGASFIVLAPEHPFLKTIDNPAVKNYVKKALSKTDKDRISEARKKTGVFTGVYAINSLNNQELPIWVSDFVLMDFGTGAVVGVPGHDIRDFQFAQQFNLPIKQVVVKKGDKPKTIKSPDQVLEDYGIVVNSEFLNGLTSQEAYQKITKYLEDQNIGQETSSYHLRDWIFSRQRYWGEPIPMVYCQSCANQNLSYFDTLEYKKELENLDKINSKLYKETIERVQKHRADFAGWYKINESELPLKLPYLKNYKPSETGESPLTAADDWVETTCPHCKKPAKRETDTMPNWAGSCWYFLRFSWQSDKLGLKAGLKQGKGWLPVDWYLGGAEHAVLHLLYARFWMHILNDLKLINFREPFVRLKNVGMVLSVDHRKMSKSLGNIINPDEVITQFGADTLRIYEMFMAPFSQEISWSTKNLLGAKRFLTKVYQLFTSTDSIANTTKEEDKKLVFKLQTTITRVSKDIANVKFNTAISSLMEFANFWQRGRLTYQNSQKYLKLLAPFAPFLAEEIWQNIFKKHTSVHLEPWPIADTSIDKQVLITIPVTVNHRVRALLQVTQDKVMDKEQVEKQALANPKIKNYLHNKKYQAMYVKGKIINFILLDENH